MPSEPKQKTADEILNSDLGLKMVDLVTDAVANRLEERIARRVEHGLLARIQELELKVAANPPILKEMTLLADGCSNLASRVRQLEAARTAHEKDLEDVRSVIGLVSLDVDRIARERAPDRRPARVTVKPEMLDLCTCGKPRGASVHLEGAPNGHVFDYFQAVRVDDPTTAAIADNTARLEQCQATNRRLSEQNEQLRNVVENLKESHRRLRDNAAADDANARLHSEIASLRNQLRVADDDRIPLRMDLDDERAVRKIVEPLLKRVGEWVAQGMQVSKTSLMANVDHHLIAAWKTYQSTMERFLNNEEEIPMEVAPVDPVHSVAVNPTDGQSERTPGG